MWLFTPFGFFSVVQKPDEEGLQVRARVKSDLDALRDRYLPELGTTIETPHGDYRFRALVAHEAFARAAGEIVKDLHYSNFKNEVARQQGADRAHRYHDIWSILYQLQADHADGLETVSCYRYRSAPQGQWSDPASRSGCRWPCLNLRRRGVA